LNTSITEFWENFFIATVLLALVPDFSSMRRNTLSSKSRALTDQGLNNPIRINTNAPLSQTTLYLNNLRECNASITAGTVLVCTIYLPSFISVQEFKIFLERCMRTQTARWSHKTKTMILQY
jgi:hypothetical protein